MLVLVTSIVSHPTGGFSHGEKGRVYSWSLTTNLVCLLQIVFMGEIMEVNESATTVTYKIDDRMGPWVDVRWWIDEQVS